MNNEELRATLVNELGINELPQEAQDEVVSKLGEIILKSITIAIFEKLGDEERKEFEEETANGDPERIQAFLSRTIPDMEELMTIETKKVLQSFREGEQLVA